MSLRKYLVVGTNGRGEKVYEKVTNGSYASLHATLDWALSKAEKVTIQRAPDT